jgi:hydroxyacylglutathione hydrolase
MLTITPIPAFNDNYIWAIHDNARGRAAVVVDPGDAVPVEAFLKSNALELTAILITHHHADHTGGIADLTANRSIPVFGPALEKIVGVNRALREGDRVSLPEVLDETLNVIELPGHTLGHIAYVGEEFVLCGDTLFAAGCGRLFEGTPEQMHASLTKLASLPPDTRVYCTHEYTLSNLRFALAVDPDNEALRRRAFDEKEKREKNLPTLPTTIALEKATNPFLRCHTHAVAASARRFSGSRIVNPTAAFAAIRSWKDNFR